MVLRQLTKEQAKEEVMKLVDKYNRIVESGSIKRYKEEDTKAEFIEPLFEALGWDVRNTENDDEVVREEKISKGRVDYSFRINGIPKFFLEAKSLKEDLDKVSTLDISEAQVSSTAVSIREEYQYSSKVNLENNEYQDLLQLAKRIA